MTARGRRQFIKGMENARDEHSSVVVDDASFQAFAERGIERTRTARLDNRAFISRSRRSILHPPVSQRELREETRGFMLMRIY